MSDNPPPVEADPTTALVRSLRRIAQLIDVRSREIAVATGLTLPQVLVLQSIRTLGQVSTQAVSRDCSMSPSTAVAVLDRLEAKGLIVRSRSSTDRRVVQTQLTPEGAAALAASPGLLRPQAMQALAALPANERQALALALEKVAGLLVSETPPPGV